MAAFIDRLETRTRRANGAVRANRSWPFFPPAKALFLASAVMLATCDNPIGPENRALCEVPLPAASATAFQLDAPSDELTIEALRPALEHAAGAMASVIGSGELAASLAGLAGFAQALNAENLPINGCRTIVAAVNVLETLPDDPATRPDRDAVRLVLALAGAALNTPNDAR